MSYDFSMDGIPGETFTMNSTDAAQLLTAAGLLSSNGNRALGVLITCETKDIKFCLGGATPVSGGLGHVLAVGQSLSLNSGPAVKLFKFISSTAGQAGVLMITPFFEPGR